MTEHVFKGGHDFLEQQFVEIDAKEELVEESVFDRCRFVKCNLGSASFRRCRFIDCIFEECDLSNLQVQGASFRDVAFRSCKAVGINWTNCSAIDRLTFDKTVLSYAIFGGLDLKKSLFKESVAREADFSDADLTESDCRGTDFKGARFANTNLTKADLRGARNYTIRVAENKVKKAKFSLPEATLLLYGLDIEIEE